MVLGLLIRHRWKISKTTTTTSLKRMPELLRRSGSDCLALIPASYFWSSAPARISSPGCRSAIRRKLLHHHPGLSHHRRDRRHTLSLRLPFYHKPDFGCPAGDHQLERIGTNIASFSSFTNTSRPGTRLNTAVYHRTSSRRIRQTRIMNVVGIISIAVGGICIIVMLIVLLCRIGAWSLCDGLERRHVV